ncbi:hypothetical protein DICVIV_14303 [Dictyocaulus viviparus]|uniref:Uncharacterized protein n=1 Tax=Dictyocaulus viviparus TaxID=29172 RepID=A0A0D8XBG6_DICVI|nr:hypothetical protein DICVIV_14303 [Dictyocaulus viviparus]
MQFEGDYQPLPFTLNGMESIMDLWILSRAAYAINRCNTSLEAFNFTQVG